MSDEQVATNESAGIKQHLVRHGLLFFIIISAVIHLTGISPAIIERLIPEEKPVQMSEAELAALAAEKAKQEQLQIMQMKKQTLREQMEDSFKSIAEGVEEEVVEEVWDKVEVKIDERFDRLEDMMNQEEYDLEAFSDDYMDASASMFEETADILKSILREELVATMVKQIKKETNPKMAKQMEKRFEEYQGKRESDRLTAAAKRDTKRRRDAAKKEVEKLKSDTARLAKEQEQLTQLEKNPNAKKEQVAKKQGALNKKSESIEKRLEAVKKEIAETTPDVAERNKDKLETDALKKAQDKQKQSLDELTKKESAQKPMQEATQALKELAKDLSDLSKDMHKGEAIDEIAKAAMKKIIEEQLKKKTQDNFDKELKDSLVPESTKRLVEESKRYLDDYKMDKDAELLAKLQEEVAKELAEGLPEAMKDSAADLIAKQAEQKHKLDDVKKSESEAVKKSAQAMSGELNRQDKQRKGETAATVKAVARSAKLGDMTEAMNELKAKLDMMMKAESMASALREGRGDMGELGEMMSMMEMMDGGSGSGSLPPGMSVPFSLPIPGKGGPFNAKSFQEMLELSRARQNPEAVYEDIQRRAKELVSMGDAFPEKRSVVIIDPRKQEEESEVAEKEERKLAEPKFKPIKFGFATMVRDDITLDGDLSDWDLDRGMLGQMTKGKGAADITLPEDKAVKFYLKWSHKGFYLAAEMPDPIKTPPPNTPKLWNGDCVEIWLDTANRRGLEMNYWEAIHCFAAPYGSIAEPNIVSSFGHGWAMRNMPNSNGKFDRNTKTGIQLGHKKTATGYNIEIFIPQLLLKGPKFAAGKYLSFHVSFNGFEGKNISWVKRVSGDFHRPDQWGDIILLGSDAEVTFCKDSEGEEALDIFVPGEPVHVRVSDPDMNIDPRFEDQIAVNVIGAGGHAQMLVLGETEKDSGTFVGGLNTHSAYIGLKKDSLPVVPGQFIRAIYIDQRRGYGELNERLEHDLHASWPTLRLSKN